MFATLTILADARRADLLHEAERERLARYTRATHRQKPPKQKANRSLPWKHALR
jgi:hypothetical protein